MSNLYLQQAVQNILQGVGSLTDSEGERIAFWAQDYLFPYPTSPRWLVVNTFAIQFQQEKENLPWVKQTYTVPFRLGVGGLGQDWQGINQFKLLEYLPLVTNYITAHPLLQFPLLTTPVTYTTWPTELDVSDGVVVAPGTRVNVEEVGEKAFIWVQFSVQLVFNVSIPVWKINNGTLQEIT